MDDAEIKEGQTLTLNYAAILEKIAKQIPADNLLTATSRTGRKFLDNHSFGLAVREASQLLQEAGISGVEQQEIIYALSYLDLKCTQETGQNTTEPESYNNDSVRSFHLIDGVVRNRLGLTRIGDINDSIARAVEKLTTDTELAILQEKGFIGEDNPELSKSSIPDDVRAEIDVAIKGGLESLQQTAAVDPNAWFKSLQQPQTAPSTPDVS